MASTAGPTTSGWYEKALAFMNGPEFIVVKAEESDAEQAANGAAGDGQFAEIILANTSSVLPPIRAAAAAGPAGAIKVGKAAVGCGGYSCTTSSGKELHNKSIIHFDKTRQVYTTEQLSPLPFQPLMFMTYATTMLSGAFKVFQYMITIMVALMVTQHAIQRYWSMAGSVSNFQVMMFVMFLCYPLVTLLLVILSNNEMCIRRFMYYRLLSLQLWRALSCRNLSCSDVSTQGSNLHVEQIHHASAVRQVLRVLLLLLLCSLQIIVDWHNTPFYKLWFFAYFAVSFICINVYSLYAGVLTKDDKTSSVFPQWSIMVMQSILLFMVWLNMVSMEDQLVSLNKVIENSPESAKELISQCDVVTEESLKLAIRNVYKRKRAFKRMSTAAQDQAGRELTQTGNSAAAFFDLLTLRRSAKNRRGQLQPEVHVGASIAFEEEKPTGCYLIWHDFKEWVEELTFRKLYAWYFCVEFWAVSMVKFRRSGKDRAAAALWPYQGDTSHFLALAAVGLFCFMTVLAVEAYAIWFLLFAKDITDRDKYGILECKQCYQYHMQAGETCALKPTADSCWSAAQLGLCAVKDALAASYGFNVTQVDALGNVAACMPLLPAV